MELEGEDKRCSGKDQKGFKYQNHSIFLQTHAILGDGHPRIRVGLRSRTDTITCMPAKMAPACRMPINRLPLLGVSRDGHIKQ